MSLQNLQFQTHLVAMEGILRDSARTDDLERTAAARQEFSLAIATLCQLPDVPKHMSTLLDTASRNHKGRREAAILVVRALAVENLLPFEEDHNLERMVAALVEAGFGDGCKGLKLSEKRQTFEKINAIKGLHESICHGLHVLCDLPKTLNEIDSLNGDIQRAIRKEQCNAYLQPFGWSGHRVKITSICDQIRELVGCKDSTYKARFEQVSELCQDLLTAASTPTFLDVELVGPFAQSVKEALLLLKSGSVDQFACSIESRRKAPYIAEKRYPLHRIDQMLTITVPMINTGPGVAVDVTVELDCGNSSSIALGIEYVNSRFGFPGGGVHFRVTLSLLTLSGSVVVSP